MIYSEDGVFYEQTKVDSCSRAFRKLNRDISTPKVEIHVYDGGKAWNYTKNTSGFPCSMKDFFYFQEKTHVESLIFAALFRVWGKVYPIWKDLADDFESGTIYSSNFLTMALPYLVM